jgi:hypothetical protein
VLCCVVCTMLSCFFVLISYLTEKTLSLVLFIFDSQFFPLHQRVPMKEKFVSHSLTLTPTVIYIRRLTRCSTAFSGRFAILRAVTKSSVGLLPAGYAVLYCVIGAFTVLKKEWEEMCLTPLLNHSLTHSLTRTDIHLHQQRYYAHICA